MSRDKRGNRTQEVDRSSPISSTTSFNNLAQTRRPPVTRYDKRVAGRPHRGNRAAIAVGCVSLALPTPNVNANE